MSYSYSPYNYAYEGIRCFPQTIAQTSNEKFLIPGDPIYKVLYTLNRNCLASKEEKGDKIEYQQLKSNCNTCG